MQFRNKKTGDVITVPCAVSGPDWEEIQERAEAPEKEAPKPRRKQKKDDA